MEQPQKPCRPLKSKRPPKPPAPNPIAAAIHDWATDLNSQSHLTTTTTIDIDIARLVATAPKRWVVYEPMVLLPSGSFTAEPWSSLLASTPSSTSLSQHLQDDLWRRILHNIGAKTAEATTHLAANDGIPLNVSKEKDESSNTTSTNNNGKEKEEENILRSPSGLRILYGDFGPASTAGPSITQADFDRAFWVSTRQNGILQTWAPRWTMFSRGNVKEKARLLAFHQHQQREQSPSKRAAALLPGNWAVDLYAGIGYFVFSYARLGMRVLAWELNPWSVEGLRRGARANVWSVRVVQGVEELRRPAHELVSLRGGGDDDAQITVFLQDNREAAARVQELRNSGDGADRDAVLPVMHVNCGLLPRSDDSWAAAREILRPATIVKGEGEDEGEDEDRVLAGWLHLHENVGAQDIEQRRAEIQTTFRHWEDEAGGGRTAEVEHVELVKTFAPSVWHCVFDVCITKKSTTIKHRNKNEGRGR